MAKEKSTRLEFHLKFNGRNPRHVSSARALASVDKQYKSSFIALAIEYYMKTHPMGISFEELMDMYRQSERTYTPKTPIAENLQNGRGRSALEASENQNGSVRHLTEAPPIQPDRNPGEDAETSSAIDKAMNYYDIT